MSLAISGRAISIVSTFNLGNSQVGKGGLPPLPILFE